MVCLDSSEDAAKVRADRRPHVPLLLTAMNELQVLEHCLHLLDGGKDHEVLLVGVAEVYSKSSVLNLLRVDFDCQILDKANKSILKGTAGMCRTG